MLPSTSLNDELSARQRFIFGAYLALFGAIAVIATGCGAYMGSEHHAPTKSSPAVAKMELPGGGTCTAWKIGHNLVASAGHCCALPDSEDYDPRKHTGVYTLKGPHAIPGSELTVLVDDDDHDVCILRGAMRGAPINLALWDPQIGERVWTAGYPRGYFVISEGFWSGRDDDGDWGVASQFVSFGASGSPLLNVRNEAVGIVVMLIRGTDNLALMSPLEHVRAALQKALLMR
jgi:hypothetical protein